MREKISYVSPSNRMEAINQKLKFADYNAILGKEKESGYPIYFVNADGLNEQIWEGIIDIYSNIFNNGEEIERPAYEEVKTVFTPLGGEVTFHPITGRNNNPLEVRTKISGHELFLRFKAYVSGAAAKPELGETFQRKVDGYLKEQGLDLVPLKEIC